MSGGFTGRARLYFTSLVTVSAFLCCACVAATFFSRAHHALELACHFFVQYFVVLSFSAAALAWLRKPKAAAAAAVFVAYCAFQVAPFCLRTEAVTAGPANGFRVISANVHLTNRSYEKIIGLARDLDPDFIFLMEVDPGWMEGLKVLDERYPYRVSAPREDCFGVAFFSKRRPDTAEIEYIGPLPLPSVRAVFSRGNKSFTLRCTHPPPPGTAATFAYRNAQLADAAARTRSGNAGGNLLIGDLNVTPWSPYFTDLTTASGLKSSSEGFGFNPTWPSFTPWFLIPIDHCLNSSDIAINRFSVGPHTGSDHYPIIVDFSLK